MSLQMFFDQACTQPVLTAEKFPGNGSQTSLILTAFTGAQLGGVYKETKNSHANITFSNGVGSGFSSLTPDALKGQRVMFGNRYAGQVTANDATTVTVSNLTFTDASPQSCYISAYKKLYTPADFTLSGETITVAIPAQANEVIHAVPTDTIAMYFGGVAGENVTKQSSIFLKRPEGFEYTALQVTSDDSSLFPYHASTDAVVFNNGVGTGFAGLPAGGLKGKAVNHNGIFRGVITDNTESTVTIDTTYTGAAAAAEIYNIGSLLFSTNGTTYAPVVHPTDMTAAVEQVREIFFKDTVKIPAAAVNYPSIMLKVSGVEYIA